MSTSISPRHDDCDTRQPLLGEPETGSSTSSPLEKSACDRKERLRRFLSFCIAIDYGLFSETPDQLTQEDLCHFVELGRRCFLRRGRDCPLLKADGLEYLYSTPADITVDDPFVQTELMEPTMELQGPCSAAVTMLRLFLHSINFWRTGYTSQIEWLVSQTSVDSLAARFWMDGFAMLKLVAPHGQEYRALVVEHMKKVERQYFHQIHCPNSDGYVLNFRGVSWWIHEQHGWRRNRFSGQQLLDHEGGSRIVKDCRERR